MNSLEQNIGGFRRQIKDVINKYGKEMLKSLTAQELANLYCQTRNISTQTYYYNCLNTLIQILTELLHIRYVPDTKYNFEQIWKDFEHKYFFNGNNGIKDNQSHIDFRNTDEWKNYRLYRYNKDKVDYLTGEPLKENFNLHHLYPDKYEELKDENFICLNPESHAFVHNYIYNPKIWERMNAIHILSNKS